MKTKSYKATFFRHNPQFKNGGYVTERKIEAVSLPSARKRAREIAEHCVYGSMELHDIEIRDMTVLERLKAAGYDPAMSLFPDSIGNAGSMECERIQIRTFFCRPRENEAAIGVTATAMTHFSDGSTRPYPDGWPRSLDASVTLYFAGDAEFHYFGNVATDLVGSDAEFRYRLLSRCIQDCKYFLGCGSRFSKYLWGCCVENHIQAMRILWDSFSDDEKPEWTSLEEIERFSKKMLEEEIY